MFRCLFKSASFSHFKLLYLRGSVCPFKDGIDNSVLQESFLESKCIKKEWAARTDNLECFFFFKENHPETLKQARQHFVMYLRFLLV